MRLDKVHIDGFKNLKNVSIDFDETRLTSVVIGQNGTGKSNLIEAIIEVFRSVDLGRNAPRFAYTLDYRIDGRQITLTNAEGAEAILVNGALISRNQFSKQKSDFFPDLIFGYYSGAGRRLEALFDAHQRRYYDVIKKDGDPSEYKHALDERRLFYCRPIHGVLALLSFFAHPDQKVSDLLKEKLGITGFHSALAQLRQPTWFNRSHWKKQKAAEETGRGRPRVDEQEAQARDLWGAKGPAGKCAEALLETAFYPLTVTNSVIDDYRAKQRLEMQLGCFLKDVQSLKDVGSRFTSEQGFFAALEALDISDLIRAMMVWVTRTNDASGDIGFEDLSDGERQLLMVLGLIRVSRGKRALFLLDEPDTHLNPAWQHTYLDLIENWTGVAADENDCHIIMTSHNPLTISSLDREEVRVLYTEEDGRISASPPYVSPKGMGFTATLTEIFGLPTSLDAETQATLDERNELAALMDRSEQQEKQLMEINEKLNRLGFLFEDREPLYQHFLRAWQDVKYENRQPATPDQLKAQHDAMAQLIRELMQEQERRH